MQKIEKTPVDCNVPPACGLVCHTCTHRYLLFRNAFFRTSKSGILCFGPSFFASAAFILSIFANGRCHLVSIDDSNLLSQFPLRVNNLGLWCYEEKGSGTLWSIEGVEGDEKLQAARGIGTACMAIGFAVWLFYIFAGCFRFGKNAFRLVGLLCIATCILQALVFLILQSRVCNGGCGIGVGGNCAIASAVLWFFAGIFSCGAGKDVEEAEAAEDAKKKEEQKEDAEAGADEEAIENEEKA
jgi:hypothetical protein